jgi:hypothetical protein
MAFETYCLLLALNSILIEKGIIEKEKLESKNCDKSVKNAKSRKS